MRELALFEVYSSNFPVTHQRFEHNSCKIGYSWYSSDKVMPSAVSGSIAASMSLLGKKARLARSVAKESQFVFVNSALFRERFEMKISSSFESCCELSEQLELGRAHYCRN